MTRSLRLTPRAVSDLESIADYTVEKWGEAQMARYLHSLNDRLIWLLDNPFAGQSREDIHPGYRSYPEGSHLIFYLVRDQSIDVIGVPHKSMDIGPDLLPAKE